MKKQYLYEEIWEDALQDILDIIEEGEGEDLDMSGDEEWFRKVGNRKKYSFRLEMVNGETVNNIEGSAVARDLDRVLTNNRRFLELSKGCIIILRMGANFILRIDIIKGNTLFHCEQNKSKSDERKIDLDDSVLINEATPNDLQQGLEPWVGENPYVLILGTFPGEMSLQTKAYYQNKSHNSFYRIMESLFQRPQGLSDKDFIISNHIALWDCMKQAKRKGSLDKNIEKYSPNEIESFLHQHPTIFTIILNGENTSKEFKSSFTKLLKENISILTLPSTSNTNSIRFEDKLKQWKVLKDILLSANL